MKSSQMLSRELTPSWVGTKEFEKTEVFRMAAFFGQPVMLIHQADKIAAVCYLMNEATLMFLWQAHGFNLTD